MIRRDLSPLYGIVRFIVGVSRGVPLPLTVTDLRAALTARDRVRGTVLCTQRTLKIRSSSIAIIHLPHHNNAYPNSVNEAKSFLPSEKVEFVTDPAYSPDLCLSLRETIGHCNQKF
ncbi:hypothetical protein EVAR_6425_1 [Eumeta japonica]|uniref:Histone-lysine N-methyltransferase SETMAR n=1 Tax=Eumeta variegata TaxID=151549 RepID=A0A4C1TFR5_EUMVA|nr:hypothetical protein EVAR_6425_1 [Eumeta japonica]